MMHTTHRAPWRTTVNKPKKKKGSRRASDASSVSATSSKPDYETIPMQRAEDAVYEDHLLQVEERGHLHMADKHHTAPAEAPRERVPPAASHTVKRADQVPCLAPRRLRRFCAPQCILDRRLRHNSIALVDVRILML